MALRKSPALVARAAQEAEFSPEGFGRRTLAETDRLRVVVAALEDGQQIPRHAPQLDLVMTIVEGIGQVMAGDRLYPVRAGDVIVVPAGEMRGLRAIGGRLVAVNVVSPPPGSSDHSHSTVAWPADEEAPDLAVLILTEHAGLFPHLPELGARVSNGKWRMFMQQTPTRQVPAAHAHASGRIVMRTLVFPTQTPREPGGGFGRAR